MSRLRRLAFAVAFATSIPAARAASPADEQAAEQMFQQGLADMLAGRYASACPALAESLRLDRLPGTLFTLAECEAKAGRIIAARGRYQEFLDLVETLAPDRRQRQRERERISRAQLDSLAARVPTLTLRLPAGASATIVIKLDGAVVDRAALGSAAPIDPGDHDVRVEDQGSEAVTQVVTVSEGEHLELALRLPAPAPVLPPPVLGVSRPIENREPLVDQDQSRSRRLRRAGAVAGVVGLGVAALGGLSWFIARHKVDAIDADASSDAAYDPSNGNYRTYEVAGYALLAAGGAALVGGAVSYWLGRRGPNPAP